MPFVLGTALSKARKFSNEERLELVHEAIRNYYGNDVTIVSTFDNTALAFNKEKKLREVSYEWNEQGEVVVSGDKASRAVPILSESDIPRHVARELKSITKVMMRGGDVEVPRIRELSILLKEDEYYWISDLVSKIEESSSDKSEWYRMYESNVEKIRTSLYGRVRELEGNVPKTRYSKIAEDRLGEFESEIKESIGILCDLYSGFISRCNGFCFPEKHGFLSSVRESMNAEAQAVVGLLGKAEKLLGREDLPLIARAHDRMADRARTMALVTEYMGLRSQPNTKE